MYIYIYSGLVVSTLLKNISQLGCFFPIYGKSKMFQTTSIVSAYVSLLLKNSPIYKYPQGQRLDNYGKSQCFMEKSTMNGNVQ